MIELAFCESAAGALKFAKSMKPGERMQCAAGVIGGTAKERKQLMREAKKPREWHGEALGGDPRDIAMLMLCADIGDISDADSGLQQRKAVLDLLYGEFAGVPDGIWNTTLKGLKRLEEAKTTHEPVRMWVCEASPAELCGLRLVCHLLQGADTPLSTVFVPAQIEKDGCLIEYRGMGDVDAELLGAMAAAYERPVSDALRQIYAAEWRALAGENAPLRALVNGRLLSVPEDFYDFALRAHMPEGEFRMAVLIGKTLGALPGVSDRWLYLRTMAMLRSGELIEVTPATGDHPYSAVIRSTR